MSLDVGGTLTRAVVKKNEVYSQLFGIPRFIGELMNGIYCFKTLFESLKC